MRYQRMKRLLAYNDTTLARISRKYGFSYNSLYRWARDNRAGKNDRALFEKALLQEAGFKEGEDQ